MVRLTLAVALLLMLVPVLPAQQGATEIEITVSKKAHDHQQDDAHNHDHDGDQANIDVAILLDTSNSMDGLISQAKSQLWTIVQTFAKTKKNGQLPKLRVSVFEYGNSKLPATENYIRQVLPLSDDLDKVSEALFALTTSGGDEYCGAVITESVKRLDWSSEAGSYKAIFIAGNEPFDQGGVDYREACGRSIGSGIVVNTIHCGDNSEGVNTHWADGARIGEGKSLNIDQDVSTVTIKSPQDKRLIELNIKLNSTYLWYGADGERKAMAANQEAQDNNYSLMGESALAGRGAAKANGLYRFKGREMVDSFGDDFDSAIEVEDKSLPEEMQSMTPDQRVEHLKKKAAERESIKAEIVALTADREKFIAAERSSQSGAAELTFGEALITAVEGQLEERDFEMAK